MTTQTPLEFMAEVVRPHQDYLTIARYTIGNYNRNRQYRDLHLWYPNYVNAQFDVYIQESLLANSEYGVTSLLKDGRHVLIADCDVTDAALIKQAFPDGKLARTDKGYHVYTKRVLDSLEVWYLHLNRVARDYHCIDTAWLSASRAQQNAVLRITSYVKQYTPRFAEKCAFCGCEFFLRDAKNTLGFKTLIPKTPLKAYWCDSCSAVALARLADAGMAQHVKISEETSTEVHSSEAPSQRIDIQGAIAHSSRVQRESQARGEDGLDTP